MREDVNITLSHDEALVLCDFFSRFCETDDGFTMRHTAEYLAFMRVASQLDKALVEPFQRDYVQQVHAARDRLAAGYEGRAPGVRY